MRFHDDDHKLCSYEFPEHWQGPPNDFVWLIASLVVPAGVMWLLYARVICNLWFKNDSNDVGHLAVINARKQITKMMLIVSLIYILCFFTDNFVYIFHSFHPNVFPILTIHWMPEVFKDKSRETAISEVQSGEEREK